MKMPALFKNRVTALLGLLMAASGIFQTACGEDKPTPRICIVIVGDPSGNVAEWNTEEAFTFKDAEEEMNPPSKLYYQSKGSYAALTFSLGQATHPITATQTPLILFKRSDPAKGTPVYTPVIELPVLHTSLTYAVLWRDKQNPSWKKPATLSIDASAEAWPQGEVRFLNLSPSVMSLKVGEEAIKLDPRASHGAQVVGDKPLQYKIAAEADGKSIFVCNTTYSMPTPKRTLIVMYGNQKDEPGSMVIDIPMP
jgi:hypothetical protein